MTYDYWTKMLDDEWPEIDATIAESGGENLESLLSEGASGTAYYRFLERASLAFHYYDVLEENRREDVRTAYKARLLPNFTVPDSVIELKDDLGLDSPQVDATVLPRLAAVWQFEFTLAEDYLSQDDVGLYVIENPVRKERVLKIPVVGPTTWKGALRSAFRLEHGLADDDSLVVRLFGEALEGEEGKVGRLRCFPSYFNKIGLMVINPHDRELGVGARPILFETVPSGCVATFTLLYLPRGNPSLTQMAKDLRTTSEAVEAIFRGYGFGAKTSSGFGTAEETIAGHFWLKYPNPDFELGERPTVPKVPERAEAFRDKYQDKYPDEQFQHKPDEWREEHSATNAERDEYKKARSAYLDYEECLEAYEEELAEWETKREEGPSSVTKRPFESLAEMVSTMKELAAALEEVDG